MNLKQTKLYLPLVKVQNGGRNLLFAMALLLVFSLVVGLVSYNSQFIQTETTIRPPPPLPAQRTTQLVMSPPPAPSKVEHYLTPEYFQLLTTNRNLILLEPSILSQMLNQSEEEKEDLQWRFNLPEMFDWKRNSLTIGVFNDHDVFSNASVVNMMGNFREVTRVIGLNGPFDQSTAQNYSSLLHVFYELSNSSIGIDLHLHLVVLYRVKEFLWVGTIPERVQFELSDQYEHNPNRSYILHYGKFASIYDPFNSTSIDGVISYPDNIVHFLSQLPTHRYLHCSPDKTTKWFKENNQTIKQSKVDSTRYGIIGLKGLMRHMKMEFWMACGTLLGWYRQCQITPYTTDTDFSTWSKYVKAADLTSVLQTNARKHDLYLFNRFGERTSSLEYSFISKKKSEKLDMFFIYQNETHFLLPFHVAPKYSYSVYPKYDLCSVELLGYKLLAPCEPEKVIQVEYGPEWNKPIISWSYYKAPKNIAPLRPFNFSVTQWQQYKN